MTDEAKPTCKATTKAGRSCRKPAVERGFCLFHSGKLDLSEQGRRGGKLAASALAELLSGRRGCERTCEALVAWARAS